MGSPPKHWPAPTDDELEQRAAAIIDAMCKGDRWRLSIPAQPTDSDMTLSELVARFSRLRTELAALRVDYEITVRERSGLFDLTEELEAELAALHRERETLLAALEHIGWIALDDAAPTPEMGDALAAEFWRVVAYSMSTTANNAIAADRTPPPVAVRDETPETTNG
jgi:hypothetical protein